MCKNVRTMLDPVFIFFFQTHLFRQNEKNQNILFHQFWILKSFNFAKPKEILCPLWLISNCRATGGNPAWIARNGSIIWRKQLYFCGLKIPRVFWTRHTFGNYSINLRIKHLLAIYPKIIFKARYITFLHFRKNILITVSHPGAKQHDTGFKIKISWGDRSLRRY
jgi:hypothetical protein